MRARQSLLAAVVSVDVEPAEAVHALELLETVERHLAGSGHELQQLGALFLVKGPHGPPEPLYLRRRRGVVVVLGVVLPVVHVNFR